MTAPIRVRLSRRPGFNLQHVSLLANGLPAVNVARPGRFGNPFTVTGCREAGWSGDHLALLARCVEAFRVWIDTPHWRNNWEGPKAEHARASMLAGMPTLRGKNLACWCPLDAPCHADVLIEIANREAMT